MWRDAKYAMQNVGSVALPEDFPEEVDILRERNAPE